MNRKFIESYIRKMEPEPTTLKASYRPKAKVLCILFDIYGTLFISASGDIGLLQENPEKAQDLQDLINQYQIPFSVGNLVNSLTNEIKKTHSQAEASGIEYPEVNIVSVWNSILNSNGRFAESEIREFAIRFELIINPVYPMPGVGESLRKCSQSQKVMGIISNAQFYTPFLFEWFLDGNMEQLGFKKDLTFLSFEHGIAKPSCNLFQKAKINLRELGIPSDQVVYLGNDMLKDILPAKQAGFQTALFAGDARSLKLRNDDPRCKNIKPDMVVTKLNQITNW